LSQTCGCNMVAWTNVAIAGEYAHVFGMIRRDLDAVGPTPPRIRWTIALAAG